MTKTTTDLAAERNIARAFIKWAEGHGPTPNWTQAELVDVFRSYLALSDADLLRDGAGRTGELVEAEIENNTMIRQRLAAAIMAFLKEYPESSLIRLATPPAPFRDGTTVGVQPAARIPSPDIKRPTPASAPRGQVTDKTEAWDMRDRKKPGVGE